MSLTAHPIILNQAEELTWEAAYDILTAQDEKYVESTVPPVNPALGKCSCIVL